MMMPRKSLWFGLALSLVLTLLFSVSADARPKKKKYAERSLGPPSLSLAADQTVVRSCDSAGILLTATATSPGSRTLNYRWSANDGKLRGDGGRRTWDLSGLAPGVYQAVVEVDDG